MKNAYKVRRGGHGFTLLEVLLAMALLSIIMVLLFAALATSAKSWNLGEHKIVQVNEKALAYGFFKHYLAAARPLVSGASSSIAFQGDGQSLEFVANGPLSAGFNGLQTFNLSQRSSDEGGEIIVTLKPYPLAGEDSGEADIEEQVLLSQVDTFKIEYFDRDEGGWVGQWSEREVLPALVKISIGLLDQSDWPPMIIAMKLAGAGADLTLPALGL